MSDMQEQGNAKGFVKTLEGAAKDAEAARLRGMRLSYGQIAKQMGYADPSGAFKAVQRALKAVPAEAVEELRTSQAELLDLLERKALAIVAKHKPTINMGKRYDDVDDDAQVIAAMNTIVRIEERRARLFNLDVEPKRGADDDGLFDSEIERFLAQLGQGNQSPSVAEPEG